MIDPPTSGAISKLVREQMIDAPQCNDMLIVILDHATKFQKTLFLIAPQTFLRVAIPVRMGIHTFTNFCSRTIWRVAV